MSNDELMTPLDYVYIGEMFNAKKRCVVFGVIEDNLITKRFIMDYTRTAARRIGSVYRGATFSPDIKTVQGYDNAVYDRQWHDQQDVIEWQAKQKTFEHELNQAKIEKDIGLKNAIETAMIPLRDVHAKLVNKRDVAGCMALEHAVLLALRTPVKEREKK